MLKTYIMKAALQTSILLSLLASLTLTGCRDRGCTDPLADNYDPFATISGNCIYGGCTDTRADNYEPSATRNNGTCIYSGCTDPASINYNPLATRDDGSCQYVTTGSVMFWSSVQCCAIRVIFENQDVGNIEYYFDVEPGCAQQQGTILLNCDAGTYTFRAETISGGGFQWSGTVQVEAGNCLSYELYL